jgi:hypothetical protein
MVAVVPKPMYVVSPCADTLAKPKIRANSRVLLSPLFLPLITQGNILLSLPNSQFLE